MTRFSDLPVGAKFTTEFLNPKVKVWEKTGKVSCKGHTARGKKVQQLLFVDTFEVKEMK